MIRHFWNRCRYPVAAAFAGLLACRLATWLAAAPLRRCAARRQFRRGMRPTRSSAPAPAPVPARSWLCSPRGLSYLWSSVKRHRSTRSTRPRTTPRRPSGRAAGWPSGAAAAHKGMNHEWAALWVRGSLCQHVSYSGVRAARTLQLASPGVLARVVASRSYVTGDTDVAFAGPGSGPGQGCRPPRPASRVQIC